MNSKEMRWLSLIAIHVAEELFGRKTTKQERSNFRGSEGSLRPVEFNGQYGKRRLEQFRREKKIIIRLGLLPTVEANGLVQEGKRWLEQLKRVLQRFAVKLGRKGLPVDIVLATIAEDGTATNFHGRESLDRSIGGG